MEEQKETAFVDEGVIVCQICGLTSCEWVEFGDEVKDYSKRLFILKAIHSMIAMTDRDGIFIPNKKMRKALYKIFTY
jgi:hypothetical protein